MTAPNFPHMPSKPTTGGVSTTGSQRDRRFTDTFYDTHKHPVKFPTGRPFTGEREFTSGTDRESITAGFITSDLQCGAYFCDTPEMGQTPQERMATLASCWQAPWIPIAKYFRFNYRQKRITFAYDKMIADEQQGLARYWDAAAKLAGENDIIDPDRPQAVPFRIRTLLGSPATYMGKVRLARAAQAGDPWLLGFVETPNEELAKILGLNVNYVGGHAGDHEHTITREPAEAKPLMTPEQVLSVSSADLQKMIVDAVAAHDAAKSQAAKDRMAKARAAKGKKAAEAA